MKTVYVSDLLAQAPGVDVHLQGWLKNRRESGGIIFLDVCDSTGVIQSICEERALPSVVFEKIRRVPLESAICSVWYGVGATHSLASQHSSRT